MQTAWFRRATSTAAPIQTIAQKTGFSRFESARGNSVDKAGLRLGPVFRLGEMLFGYAGKSVPGGLVSVVGLFGVPDHGAFRDFERSQHARLILDDKADVRLAKAPRRNLEGHFMRHGALPADDGTASGRSFEIGIKDAHSRPVWLVVFDKLHVPR